MALSYVEIVNINIELQAKLNNELKTQTRKGLGFLCSEAAGGSERPLVYIMFHVKQTFDKAVCRASSDSVQNISSVDRFFQNCGLFCNLSQ